MIKAGLIGAVLGFIFVMSLTLVSPFCTPCLTPLLGLGIGYLAGWFDRPPKLEASLSVGAVAGSISGVAALLGQMLATVVNGVLITNWKELPLFMSDLGLPQVLDTGQYWQTTLMANAFCSLINLVLMAGLGVIGGMIWFQRQNHSLPSIV